VLAGWEVAGAQATIPRIWRRVAYLTVHLIGHTRPSRVTAGNPQGNRNDYTTRGGQGASWTGREAGSRKASLQPPLRDPKNLHPLAAARWDSPRQRALHSSTERTPLNLGRLTTGSADAARNVLRCRRGPPLLSANHKMCSLYRQTVARAVIPPFLPTAPSPSVACTPPIGYNHCRLNPKGRTSLPTSGGRRKSG
jgi:hypothetical protein